MPLISYDDFRDRVLHDPDFSSFSAILQYEPLLKFIYHEKCRFPGPIPEDRVVKLTSYSTGGYGVEVSMPEDEYYPGKLNVFDIKGIWLPSEEGDLYSTQPDDYNCYLTKKIGTKKFVLFLIHPKSESLYADLIRIHAASIIKISALSLSSFRSLLVAIPQDDGTFKPVMVKVSLDQEIQTVRRVLTRRECALSVANTEIFQKKLAKHPAFPLHIFKDTWAYIPDGYDFGMLYRAMPDYLNPEHHSADGTYVIPLLSLYGTDNLDLLQHLVRANASNVSDFLVSCILKPFAHIFITLLLDEELSIEAHGQNLMLQLDVNDRVTGLVYRDMGGVNQLLSTQELESLPLKLQDPAIYYFLNHDIDAAKALEDHFVRRGLFPLTKQLVKCRAFGEDDRDYSQWRMWCKTKHYLGNWTTEKLDSNDHKTELSATEFLRYGYVEYLFYLCFINCIKERGLVEDSIIAQMEREFTSPQQLPDQSIIAACSTFDFFKTNITRLLAFKRDRDELLSSPMPQP